ERAQGGQRRPAVAADRDSRTAGGRLGLPRSPRACRAPAGRREHSPPRTPLDETIVAAHLVYQVPLFEQLNEAIFIRHTPADTRATATTSSFYSQISRQFGRGRPSFAYQFLDVPNSELVFANQIGRSYGPTVGLRIDAAPPVAIKLEYTRLTGSIE